MIRRSLAIVVLLLGFARGAAAEVIGPQLPRGAFQAGLEARWIKREVYYGVNELDWEESGVDAVARWGVTELATASVEVSRRSVWLGGDFKSADFSYLVGGAIQASLWRSDRVIVSAAFQFTTTLLRIDEGTDRNITSKTAGGQLVAQYRFAIAGAGINAWAGPAYSLFYPTFERQLDRSYVEWYTESNWGGVLGADALLWKHVDLNGYLLWVENPQPRVALSYRF